MEQLLKYKLACYSRFYVHRYRNLICTCLRWLTENMEAYPAMQPISPAIPQNEFKYVSGLVSFELQATLWIMSPGPAASKSIVLLVSTSELSIDLCTMSALCIILVK